jgi:hypothetical protein
MDEGKRIYLKKRGEEVSPPVMGGDQEEGEALLHATIFLELHEFGL